MRKLIKPCINLSEYWTGMKRSNIIYTPPFYGPQLPNTSIQDFEHGESTRLSPQPQPGQPRTSHAPTVKLISNQRGIKVCSSNQPTIRTFFSSRGLLPMTAFDAKNGINIVAVGSLTNGQLWLFIRETNSTSANLLDNLKT